MRTQSLLLAGLLAAALLAGCSGNTNNTGNGSGTSGAPTSDGSGANGGSTPGGPTAGGMKWAEESVTGTFEATPEGASGATGAIAKFTVPDNATDVYYNMTITSTVPTGTPATEFQLLYHDADHAGPTDTAQATSNTANGVASAKVSAPLSGAWTVSIFSTGAPNQGSFTLKVNSHVPV